MLYRAQTIDSRTQLLWGTFRTGSQNKKKKHYKRKKNVKKNISPPNRKIHPDVSNPAKQMDSTNTNIPEGTIKIIITKKKIKK